MTIFHSSWNKTWLSGVRSEVHSPESLLTPNMIRVMSAHKLQQIRYVLLVQIELTMHKSHVKDMLQADERNQQYTTQSNHSIDRCLIYTILAVRASSIEPFFRRAWRDGLEKQPETGKRTKAFGSKLWNSRQFWCFVASSYQWDSWYHTKKMASSERTTAGTYIAPH